jgi:transposase
MVAAVRQAQSVRAVARRFGVSTSTVCYWIARAAGRRLDRVDWLDRSRAPKRTRRTDTTIEDLVVRVRRELRLTSDLGAFGAQAIQQALREQGQSDIPSVRTITYGVQAGTDVWTSWDSTGGCRKLGRIGWCAPRWT